VHREISVLGDEKKVVLRQTRRAVTPWGGLSVFVEFLRRRGFREQVRQHLPIRLESPNAIDPAQTFTAFLIAVVAGARRFAHAGRLGGDRARQALVGIERFPTDDTIRNLFKRFRHKLVYEFFEPLWAWQLERLPRREEGYSMDLDSTVFERYGRQEGARKGYNPHKHGRASHPPLRAVLGEATFVLHGWLRSGNCTAARGAVEFLKEALARRGTRARIRVVRADAGFFEEPLLSFLEARGLAYIVVARLTPGLKRAAARVEAWRELDADYAAGEFRLRLWNWGRERRFGVIRERVREEKPSLGRKLFDVPGYTFRIFVTNRPHPPEEIWRDYNRRADVEKRIAELKYDLAADDFCLHEFFATEAVFLAIRMLFNLLAEFQRPVGMPRYRQPPTLHVEVFLCGAILGRAGHRTVLHLSSAWGGLEHRNALLDRLLADFGPTSPKLNPEPPT
jgi:Transposase DDE domain group 1